MLFEHPQIQHPYPLTSRLFLQIWNSNLLTIPVLFTLEKEVFSNSTNIFESNFLIYVFVIEIVVVESINISSINLKSDDVKYDVCINKTQTDKNKGTSTNYNNQ